MSYLYVPFKLSVFVTTYSHRVADNTIDFIIRYMDMYFELKSQNLRLFILQLQVLKIVSSLVLYFYVLKL